MDRPRIEAGFRQRAQMIAATSHANQLAPQSNLDQSNLDQSNLEQSDLKPSDPIPLQPPPRWQHLLADAVCDPRELCTLLDLEPSLVLPALAAAKDFALRVPRSYVA